MRLLDRQRHAQARQRAARLPAGSLSAAGFTNCTNPAGPKFAPQPADLPWHVNLSSYDAATGVATGTVSHLQIPVLGNGCNFVIASTSGTASDGRVRFTYTDSGYFAAPIHDRPARTDSTGRLTVLADSGNLHFWNVSPGCLGGFNDGDRATLSATYTVSPKQAITNP